MTDVTANHELPRILEFTGHGTGLGKSLLATTAEVIYGRFGYETTMVRIETKQITHRGTHVAISTETFAKSAALVGGISAVVSPLWDEIKKIDPGRRSAIIIDWAGGFANHRCEVYAATRFAERIAARGLSATSVVVSTNTAADMTQAVALIEASQQILPGVALRVVLNRRRGGFNFPQKSEQARAFGRLKGAGVGILEIKAIGGDSWKACDEAGLAMTDVIEANVDSLADRLRLDDFIAAAIQAEVATWYAATEAELLKALSVAADR